jgi:hypothetical protein
VTYVNFNYSILTVRNAHPSVIVSLSPWVNEYNVLEFIIPVSKSSAFSQHFFIKNYCWADVIG